MTQEEKITSGLDKDLMQLIDAEMNDPVLGKLLNRNAAYVLGKEIKLALIERASKWLRENLDDYLDDWLNAHHLDYRGLIPKRLALEAPDGMYNL